MCWEVKCSIVLELLSNYIKHHNETFQTRSALFLNIKFSRHIFTEVDLA